MKAQFDVPVLSALRSPVGRGIKGALRDVRPDDLAGLAIRKAVDATSVPEENFGDLIFGCAMPEAEQGWNIARNAGFIAKLPDTVPAETINRFCSSGLQAIAHAAMNLQTELINAAIAGGVESMSMVPMGGNKISLNPRLVDHRPEAYIAMGHTAERIAKQFNVSREDQDRFAASSHDKALAAEAAGRFSEERFAIDDPRGKLSQDECPRAGTTAEALAALRPAFSAKGTVTAGNSSPLSDGAAAAVLTTESYRKDLGIDAIAYFRSFHVAGVPPEIMGIGPIPAILGLLAKTGLSIEDIALFEINEAFAAQALYCQRELKIADERLNVNGGAIALGHPLGCTGAKLSATLIHELRRRGGGLGIVSMCIGGGMGAAGLFEVR